MADPIDVRIISSQGELNVNARVTGIDRETFLVRVIPQVWDYKVISTSTADTPERLEQKLDALGRDRFELVCAVGNNLVFKKALTS